LIPALQKITDWRAFLVQETGEIREKINSVYIADTIGLRTVVKHKVLKPRPKKNLALSGGHLDDYLGLWTANGHYPVLI